MQLLQFWSFTKLQQFKRITSEILLEGFGFSKAVGLQSCVKWNFFHFYFFHFPLIMYFPSKFQEQQCYIWFLFCKFSKQLLFRTPNKRFWKPNYIIVRQFTYGIYISIMSRWSIISFFSIIFFFFFDNCSL